MKTFVKMMLCAAVLTAGVHLAWAQDGVSDQKKAQNKLLACRAARVDGIRKLAERIKGLHITSTTYVKDFVAESDNIRTALDAFLTGVRESGEPRYLADGTCEVTMEVTLETIIQTLTQIHSTCAKGDKFSSSDFQQMTQTNELKVLKETGTGAPRPEFVEADMTPVKEGTLTSDVNMSNRAREYWMTHVTPQGRLMAVRAARVDGMRKLAERIGGIQINSQTNVRDFVAESDDIRGATEFFLKGAREAGIRYHDDEPVVEVQMEVTLRTVYANMKSWSEQHYKGDKVKISQFDELTTQAQDKALTETGMGLPRADLMKDVKSETKVEVKQFNQWPAFVRAEGQGAVDTANENKAQAQLMAKRAAEMDARRKLAEQLEGLMITSNTSVKDFVAQSDDIRTSMMTFQQGGSVVPGSEKISPDGVATVTVEIDPRPLINMIMYFQKKTSVEIK